MKHEKKIKVVMLATDEKSLIYKGIISKELKLYPYLHIDSHGKNQHLYFLSDEEIKEGDWYFSGNRYEEKELSQFQVGVSSTEYYKEQGIKKIIASNNPELKEIHQNHNDFDSVFELPRPSNSFIQKFVEEYNSGNIIEEVMVEYVHKDCKILSECTCSSIEGDLILKVAPDNTITIKPVAEDWDDFWKRISVEYSLDIELDPILTGILKGNYNPPIKKK